MKGIIHTFTIIRSSTPEFMDKIPYLVGIIDYNGKKTASFIDGYNNSKQIRVGNEVTFVKYDDSGRPVFCL